MPRVKCDDCGEAFTTKDAYPFCPACGSQNAHVVSEEFVPLGDVGVADIGVQYSIATRRNPDLPETERENENEEQRHE